MNTSPQQQDQRGYTLLFAVLLMSIVLAIGISVLSISRRELILSTASRDSQTALYAADTGVECAMYQDVQAAFSTSSPAGIISCNNKTITVTTPTPSSSVAPVVFSFGFNIGQDVNGPCVAVDVTKVYAGGLLTTSVNSYGHNTCTPNYPRRVERGINVSY